MASNDFYPNNNSSHPPSQPRYAAMPSASVVAAILPEASSSSTSRRRKHKGKYSGSHHYTRDDVYGESIEKKILRSIKSKFSHRPSYEFQPDWSDARTFNSSIYTLSDQSSLGIAADTASYRSGRSIPSTITNPHPYESNYTHLDPMQLREQRRKHHQETNLQVAVVSDDSESDPDVPPKRPEADLAAINNPYALRPTASSHRPRPKTGAATYNELVTQPASSSVKTMRSHSSPNPPRVKFVKFENTSDPNIASTSTVVKQSYHSTALPKKSALKSSSSSSSFNSHPRDKVASIQIPSNNQEDSVSIPTDQNAHIRFSTHGLYIKKGVNGRSPTDPSFLANNQQQPEQSYTPTTSSQPRSLSHSPSRAHALLAEQQRQQQQRLQRNQSVADVDSTTHHRRSHHHHKLRKSRSSTSVNDSSSLLGQGPMPIPQSAYDTATFNPNTNSYYYPQPNPQVYNQPMVSMVRPSSKRSPPPDTFTQMNLYMAEIMGGPHAHDIGAEVKFLAWTFVILAIYISFKFVFGFLRSWIQPLIQLALILVVIFKVFGLGGSNSNNNNTNHAPPREGVAIPPVAPQYYIPAAQGYQQYTMNQQQPPDNPYSHYTN